MWEGGDCLGVCACGRVATTESVCMWEGGDCLSRVCGHDMGGW